MVCIIFTCTLTRFICISISSLLSTSSQSPRDHTLFTTYVHIVYPLVCGGRGLNPSRDRHLALKHSYSYTAWKNTLISGEQSNCCQDGEKPKAEGNLSTTEGQLIDCSPRSHQILEQWIMNINFSITVFEIYLIISPFYRNIKSNEKES